MAKGKFMNNIMNLFKISDDDDYDDFDDDYEDDYEEDDYQEDEAPKRASRKPSVDDYEAAAPEEDPVKETPRRNQRPESSRYDEEQPVHNKKRKTNQKVVPMRRQQSSMAVCVVKPSNVEDAKEITETLLDGKAVVLNLEGLHVDLAQRIIDFASGSCYAIDGNLQKISSYIFIITPSSVDISGDIPDLLNGGFDVSTL